MATKNTTDLDHLRHSAAHLLAAAVLELWPDAKPTIGPAIPDGFYYDFDFSEIALSERSESKGDVPSESKGDMKAESKGDSRSESKGKSISENDLKKIEKKMRKLLPGWTVFSHEEVTAEVARERFKDNPYKLELIDEIVAKGEPITLYAAGEFTDLCRGGHIENPAETLQHVKLLTLAGAYWRGDETKPQLTRIYGTVFPTQEELDEYLKNLEEAKKRDHRKLGQQLDLFTFSPLVGAGLPLFTPRGTVIRDELSTFLWELQGPRGYQKTDIPHLAKPELYKTSGHWDKFGDNLFHVRGRDDAAFVVKPMNCPHHTQIFASRPRSYKDLPIRFAEITKVYRDEQAGELLGLARVRSITQDDGHVFCTPDQVSAEIESAMTIIHDFYKPFGFELNIKLSLSDPANPDAYLGTRDIWDSAEETLRSALQQHGVDFEEEEGEAAFYGPKIDYTAIDSLKRQWQLATVQLDLNMAERFALTYKDADGNDQTPIMIHRAISGAQERFIAILLEHYAGALPLWLSPTQVAILPISDDQLAYAQELQQQLMSAGVRVEIDDRGESIGKKIRAAELMKTPIMWIVGKKEAADATVSVRSRADGDLGAIPSSQAQQQVVEQIAGRV